MSHYRIIGIILIALGALLFSYQGVITYKTREKVIEAGPIEVTAEKTKKIDIAPVLGAVALVAGITFLVFEPRRSRSSPAAA